MGNYNTSWSKFSGQGNYWIWHSMVKKDKAHFPAVVSIIYSSHRKSLSQLWPCGTASRIWTSILAESLSKKDLQEKYLDQHIFIDTIIHGETDSICPASIMLERSVVVYECGSGWVLQIWTGAEPTAAGRLAPGGGRALARRRRIDKRDRPNLFTACE